MRLYTFINFYLSQIQQGIQTAHIVHELFNKYLEDIDNNRDLDRLHFLTTWSIRHKTIIVCNAGTDIEIQQLVDTFKLYEDEFPWQEFVEDEGLCKARTGCGMVLPDWIYDVQKKFQEQEDGRFRIPYYEHFKEDTTTGEVLAHKKFFPGDKYFDLIDLIKSKRLA